MLSSPGIGSGLDVNSIISQLMAIEQQPIVSLQRKKGSFDAQISDFGKIKSALSKLQKSVAILTSAESFSKITSSSSDSAIATATVSTGAAAETHTVEVTALAKSHRLSSAVFTDQDAIVGTGTLSISNGANSFQVVIDSSNQTLAGIRDAINDATNNSGTTASIINIDGGSRLILSADNTGVINEVNVTVSQDGDGDNVDNLAGISRLVYQTSGVKNLSQLDAAIDAVIKVDTYTVTSASNEVSGVIAGVTISAKALGTATLTLKNDDSSIQSALSTLAKDYNALRKIMVSSRNEGSLAGDNLTLGMERKIRNVFSNKVSGNINYISDIGLSFDRQGNLSFDSSKLTSYLESDSAAVKELLTKADTGFATAFDSMLESYLSATGLIQNKTDGLSSSIKDINKKIVAIDYRLQKVEIRLLKQFSGLDSLLSGLQLTSNFLTQQLDNISSLTNRRR